MDIKKLFLYNAIKNVKKSWIVFFENEFKKDYFINLDKIIEFEYQNKQINPKYENIFEAFKYFDVDQTNLVILGQDPYHIKSMADGLAFSTKLNIKPKSLANIFKEIKSDFKIERNNYCLKDIANQNVLLLNTVLTVEVNKAFSHSEFGWKTFTNNLIKFLSYNNKEVVYLLMGNSAIEYKNSIFNSLKIFETSHPSPFSYHKNLKDSNTFKKINDVLETNNKKPIKW